MDCMLYIVAYSTVLFATKSLAAINCPDVLIKKGSLHVFSCDSDVNINDYYWYRGETSERSPILTLDSGQKGGSEYNTEHFDIGDNGSMIISDVKLEHESYYTLVGYYDGDNFESATFMVNVTIPPDPPCPVIEDCIPCNKCVIHHLKQSGTLKCSVSGARPLIPLAWNITSQAGVSFTKYQPVEQQNEATDSWETIVLIGYTLTTPCGVHANIYCTAHDKANIISSPVAALEISNDPCADVVSTLAPTDVDASSRQRLILITCISFLIIVLLILVVICLMWKKRQDKKKREKRWPGLSTLEEQDDPEGVPLLIMPPTKGKKASRIVSLLERTYEKYCYVKPLPWGEDIQINALYTNCQCKVTTRNGKTHTITSDKLLTSKIIMNEKRVLFIGDLGFGKTTFTKHEVNKWIHDKNEKFLLIYILLKDVKSDMKLTEIVLSHLPVKSNVTVDEVENTISQYGCFVLLDGLDELSMAAEKRSGSAKDENHSETVQSATSEGSVSSLTLQQMLNGDIKLKDINIKIWVTSREIDYANSGFPTPYVKVKMTGFSEEQAEDYIKKTCRYYCPPKAKADDELRITTSNPISSTSTEVDLSMKNGQTAQGDQEKIGQINVGKVTDTKENAMYASTIVDERMKGEDGSKGESKNTEVMNKHRILEEWEKVSGNVKQFLERNDVLSSFKKTPLLFIMMVHIISAKHTSAFDELKEITINKLTTLISTVFICLESRYVQKRNMSSSEEITHLESKLGETALRHNVQITVEEPEFWVSAIGEKNVKMALEIGLLRQSTNAAASSKGFRHLAFSSFTGIEFYNELFQAYIAANFVKENKGHMEQLIRSVKNTKEHETFRVLQFLCGLDGSVMETVCNALRGFNKYNNLIDCLYEGNDQETFKKVVQGLAGDTLNISYLDRSYHRNSLSTFCMKCNELGVQLHSMVFHSDCVISYLTTLRLPELYYLDFVEAALNEADFLSVLKWLPNQTIHGLVRFFQCKIPQKISNEHLEEVERQNQKDVKIYRKKNKNDKTVSQFNYESGKWSWKPLKSGV